MSNETRAAWSSAYITALPDSAFACVEGKERFYPHHDSSGSVDLPHLRAALSRVGDPNNQQCGKAHLEAHAKAEGLGDRAEAPTYETRHVWSMDQVEVRETPGGGMHFSGYAAAFNSDSEPLPFIESLEPGSFRRTLRNGREVRMFLNHNQDFVLGTTNSNVKLSEDDHGLLTEADFVPTSYAIDLATNIRNKIVTKMSFGFTVPKGGDSWDGNRRRLKEVNLFDVSPVTGFPAYSQTSAVIRSLAAGLGAEQGELALAIRAMTESTGLLSDEQVTLLTSVIQARRAKPKVDWTAEFARLRGAN